MADPSSALSPPRDLGGPAHTAMRHQGSITDRDLSCIRQETWLGALLLPERSLPRGNPKAVGNSGLTRDDSVLRVRRMTGSVTVRPWQVTPSKPPYQHRQNVQGGHPQF